MKAPLPAQISIPNDLAYVTAALSFVREMALVAGLDSRQARHFEGATEEAVANVVRHAYPEGESALFEVRCERQTTGFMVAVCDRGLPIDVDSLAATGRGLGATLMKGLVSRVSYVNLGNRGKEVQLFHPYLAESVLPEEPVAATAPSVQSIQAGELSVRPMRPDEAVQVSRCFFEAYGYSYVHEDVYYPERLAALQAGGQLFSAVAVTSADEVVSHVALRFSDHLPAVAEVAMAATRPKFQGQKAVRTLEKVIMGEALRRRLRGVYSNAVTVHAYSQRSLLASGFKICGFLLAHSLETTSFKHLVEGPRERGSVMICYLPLVPPGGPSLIYPPTSCRDLVQRIYANLGLPVELGADDSIIRDSGVFTVKSQVNLTLHTERAVATLNLQQYGLDINDRVREALYRCKKERMQVVEAFLNLTNAHTPALAELLEQEGFRFSSILPGVEGGDRLIMQYFNGIAADYASIRVEDPLALEILQEIRSRDPLGGFA